MSGLAGHDASQGRVLAVQAALVTLAAELGLVRDVHDVRVRETIGGEIVNFHCFVDSEQTVAAVHERVDELERALKVKFPAIKRVIGHAEPRR